MESDTLKGICKECGREWEYTSGRTIGWTCKNCLKEIKEAKETKENGK